MSLGRVHTQNLADDLLAFPHVVSDVLDPTGRHIANVNEAFLAAILVEGYERPEVLDVLHGADHELPFLGELADPSH